VADIPQSTCFRECLRASPAENRILRPFVEPAPTILFGKVDRNGYRAADDYSTRHQAGDRKSLNSYCFKNLEDLSPKLQARPVMTSAATSFTRGGEDCAARSRVALNANPA
jgi:hypothetical protein